MSFDRQVEAPQPVPGETVGPALQDDRARSEARDDRVHDVPEQPDVRVVVNPVLEGHVEGEVFALVQTRLDDSSCSGEEAVAVLVKRDGQDPVGPVECFLDAVPVMNINVDVEYSRMYPAARYLWSACTPPSSQPR